MGDAFVREAKRMDSVPPTVIGYGITSDPVRDVSYDDLFAAAQLSVKEPWRAINVDQGSVDVQECAGYVQRKMTLRASGERVTERVTINEEMGEIRYNKCDSYGTPGDVERVLAIHTPLRIEFYERSARSGQRKGAGHERLHAAIHAPSGKAWQPDCDRQHPRDGGCPGDLVPPRQEWSGVRGGAGVCFAHGASQI